MIHLHEIHNTHFSDMLLANLYHIQHVSLTSRAYRKEVRINTDVKDYDSRDGAVESPIEILGFIDSNLWYYWRWEISRLDQWKRKGSPQPDFSKISIGNYGKRNTWG